MQKKNDELLSEAKKEPAALAKKHQLNKTKTNDYEQQRKQQQKHVGKDSPSSNHCADRHRNHLRGDIVHGILTSLLGLFRNDDSYDSYDSYFFALQMRMDKGGWMLNVAVSLRICNAEEMSWGFVIPIPLHS